jgi:hypothetical protein
LFFNNIMEGIVSDIFDAFVFNNIMEDTFIFSPRIFWGSMPCDDINVFNFNSLQFWTTRDQFR